MKKILCALFVTAILPHFEPMFPGMIVRCDDQGRCHWECEFGIVNATTTVNDNLVEKSVGCAPKPPPLAPIVEYRTPWSNIISTGSITPN